MEEKSEHDRAMQHVFEASSSYHQYQSMGGIINEKECQSALERAKNAPKTDSALVLQAERIAHHAGIELHNEPDSVDPRVALYGILRTDMKPVNVAHHHSQMSDQRLFAEALRMLGDADSLQKMTAAYPTISF